MATIVHPFLVGGRWPRRLDLAAAVPEVVRGVIRHAADQTGTGGGEGPPIGIAVVVGLVPAELVAATETDPGIRAAALTDPRLRQLQLAIFRRAPLDGRHLRELVVIGVVFAVWTLLPTLSETTMRLFMSALVVHPDVVQTEPGAPRRGMRAVRAALAACEVAAHGGDEDLLPDQPPGQRV
ncbi:hypothetical protein [Gandjariella thermophila]|uniref:Uncharacterized protein n=1 Tax=Gandjariella thermophila TaxID=1931992 RepID=A0A4D4JDQ1_9PSEU|nr:hypothetical protein [Gandjariella thermophila]GDY32516.1 hypothetical protein GTS_41490 [Gandjariella thermophila]